MTHPSRLRSSHWRLWGITLLLSSTFFFTRATAHANRADQTASGPASSALGVKLDSDNIGGVVTSSQGPEAGVWVIAETHDLPVRFFKIVVTPASPPK